MSLLTYMYSIYRKSPILLKMLFLKCFPYSLFYFQGWEVAAALTASKYTCQVEYCQCSSDNLAVRSCDQPGGGSSSNYLPPPPCPICDCHCILVSWRGALPHFLPGFSTTTSLAVPCKLFIYSQFKCCLSNLSIKCQHTYLAPKFMAPMLL